MKAVGVVGSRHFPSRDVVVSFVRSLPAGTVVVSGGAQGVDSWAVEAAEKRGLETVVVHADWKRLGRGAGPIRNADLVSKVDEVVAFWDGTSRGTLNTVMLALNAKVPVLVRDNAGSVLPMGRVVHEAKRRGVIAAIEKARR